MNDARVLLALSCTLPEGDAGRRRAEVGQLFAQSARATDRDGGVELEFHGDPVTARALFDFVMFERDCCAQLSYALRFNPPHRAVQLRITGAPDLLTAIRAFVGLAER